MRMKARVKATGEIIELDEINISVMDYARGIYKDKSNGTKYKSRELEFLQTKNEDTIDWNQVRIQAAIAAMQGILSDEDEVGYACSEATYKENEKYTIPVAVARFAAACADALIIELKEKGGKYEE